MWHLREGSCLIWQRDPDQFRLTYELKVTEE